MTIEEFRREALDADGVDRAYTLSTLTALRPCIVQFGTGLLPLRLDTGAWHVAPDIPPFPEGWTP